MQSFGRYRECSEPGRPIERLKLFQRHGTIGSCLVMVRFLLSVGASTADYASTGAHFVCPNFVRGVLLAPGSFCRSDGALPIHTDEFFVHLAAVAAICAQTSGSFLPRFLLGMACLAVAVFGAELSCMLCVLAPLPGRQTDSLPFESPLHDTRLEFQCRTGHPS